MARNKSMNFISLGLCLGLASCAQRPLTTSTPSSPAASLSLPSATSPTSTPTPVPTPEALSPAPKETAHTPASAFVSNARSAKDYRADAARHLYDTYQHRIYQGKLPPMLKAVGVVEVAVNSKGQVEDIVWLRAPRHVPEVMREIETALRQAAPYPAPVHMKHVKYIDTWLWHASGRFQLDTLTEGQY